MSGDTRETWLLTLRQPNRELVQKEVPVPRSLEELLSSLGVDSTQSLLIAHRQHPDQMFMVESLDQVQDGAIVAVHIPRRRIYISGPPGIRNKAVMWYPGATAEQIEKSIAKAAGFPPGTAIELRDGEATVVLSTTIPNDTHLEVVAFEAQVQQRQQPPATPSGRLTPAQPPPSAKPKGLEARGSGKLQASLSNNSVGSGSLYSTGGNLRKERSDKSPQRQKSPSRAAGLRGALVASSSVSGSTTPAAHQSAPEEHCVHILAGHTGSVLCLCGVGDILFTGSQDGSIMIWDLNNLQYIGTLPGHRGFVKCLHSSYAKKVLCSGSQDRTIRVWSLESFSTVKTLYGHTGGVNTVLILEGPDVLVSGAEDRSVRVWDLATFEPLANLEQAHLGGVFALERFGSPSQVVSGARDRSLKVWDSSTWTVTKTLHPPHYDGVTSIAVAGKHGKFYSASRDRSIKEWDVNSLTNTMHTLHVHGDWVQALCMSPSDDILFSGSRDATVKVWDDQLQCQDVLQGHRGPVSALTTVGNRLFSASHDRTVRVWRIEQYG
eukprot:gb/GFBE01044027.1/.p1 GENE.gb/GFBE01044027.1/~~gb/GFBE01044027.1/.p1  ORF type:complete len:548 (+),score=72.37 gb/GFBE01044027.1/:1-1644(+)